LIIAFMEAYYGFFKYAKLYEEKIRMTNGEIRRKSE